MAAAASKPLRFCRSRFLSANLNDMAVEKLLSFPLDWLNWSIQPSRRERVGVYSTSDHVIFLRCIFAHVRHVPLLQGRVLHKKHNVKFVPVLILLGKFFGCHQQTQEIPAGNEIPAAVADMVNFSLILLRSRPENGLKCQLPQEALAFPVVTTAYAVVRAYARAHPRAYAAGASACAYTRA